MIENDRLGGLQRTLAMPDAIQENRTGNKQKKCQIGFTLNRHYLRKPKPNDEKICFGERCLKRAAIIFAGIVETHAHIPSTIRP